MKAGLIVVDVQAGLFESSPRFDADGVIRRINALAEAVRAGGGAVVFIQHEDDDSLAYGSPGWRLHPGLDARSEDAYVRKTASDSFYRSDLEETLRERRVTRLLFTGCATEFCVDTAIRSAVSRDYEVVVVADGHTTADRPHLPAEKIIEHPNWVWSNLILPGRPVVVAKTETILSRI